MQVARAFGGGIDSFRVIQLLEENSDNLEWVLRSVRLYVKECRMCELVYLASPSQVGMLTLAENAIQILESPYISKVCAIEASKLLASTLEHLASNEDKREMQLKKYQAEIQCQKKRLPALLDKARCMQKTWRSVRFSTFALGKLDLEGQDSDLDWRAVKADAPNESSMEGDTSLSTEIESYAQQIQHRREQFENNIGLRLKEEREARGHELNFRRKYEDVCRRWRYFVARLNSIEIPEYLALNRFSTSLDEENDSLHQDQHKGIKSIRDTLMQFSLTTPRSLVTDCDGDAVRIATRRGWLKENALCRRLIYRFTTRSVQLGLAHAVYDTVMTHSQQHSLHGSSHAPLLEDFLSSSSLPRQKLRIGILSCDITSGSRFSNAYRNFFDQLATKSHTIEWHLYDCTVSQFPSRAMQRSLDGFIIIGSPVLSNKGLPIHQELSILSDRLQPPQLKISLQNLSWRRKLITLLQYWHTRKRIRIAAIGHGHVILGEALGGKVERSEWEMGWNVINKAYLPKQQKQNVKLDQEMTKRDTLNGTRRKKLAFPFLHGEFISDLSDSTDNLKSDLVHVIKSDDRSFVSGLRSRFVLSFDGLLVCEYFRLEMIREIYEHNQDRLSQSKSHDSSAELKDDIAGRVSEILGRQRHKLGLTDASITLGNAMLSHISRSCSPNQIEECRKHRRPPDIPLYVSWDTCTKTSSEAQTFQYMKGIYVYVHFAADNYPIVFGCDTLLQQIEHCDTGKTCLEVNSSGPYRLSQTLQELQENFSSFKGRILLLPTALTLVKKTCERAGVVSALYKKVRGLNKNKEIIMILPQDSRFGSSLLIIPSQHSLQELCSQVLAAVQISAIQTFPITIVSSCAHTIQHFRSQRPIWKYVYRGHGDISQHIQAFPSYKNFADGILLPSTYIFQSSWTAATSLRAKAKENSLKLYATFISSDEDRKVSRPWTSSGISSMHASQHRPSQPSLHTNHLAWLNASHGEGSIASFKILQHLGINGILINSCRYSIDPNVILRPEMTNAVARVLKKWEAKGFLTDSQQTDTDFSTLSYNHATPRVISSIQGQLRSCKVKSDEEMLLQSVDYQQNEIFRQATINTRMIATHPVAPKSKRRAPSRFSSRIRQTVDVSPRMRLHTIEISEPTQIDHDTLLHRREKTLTSTLKMIGKKKAIKGKKKAIGSSCS